MDYIPEENLKKMDKIASVVLDDMIRLKRTKLYAMGDTDQNLELFASYWNLNLVIRAGRNNTSSEEKKVLEKLLETPILFEIPSERNGATYQANVGLLTSLRTF